MRIAKGLFLLVNPEDCKKSHHHTLEEASPQDMIKEGDAEQQTRPIQGCVSLRESIICVLVSCGAESL
jgi:hypothetical protein